MLTPEELLAARSGVVVAPAGCGKTHLLVDTVVAGPGRMLVLTHTRAGVAVIRNRLLEKLIKPSRCRVATLDNWCAWIASRVPGLSGFIPTGNSDDYRKSQLGALKVLASSAIQTALAQTYDRVFVDEYQDCSGLQHDIVLALAAAVPVIAFGDPMQRIFDFNGSHSPSWPDVLGAFKTTWMLDTPWRWINVEERAFGEWILKQRSLLEAGGKVDFSIAPANVTWVKLPSEAAVQRQHSLNAVPRPTPGSSLFVLNDSRLRNERHDIARQGVLLSVVESAEMPDLSTWAHTFGRASAADLIEHVIAFAAVVMTGIEKTALLARINVLKRGAERRSASEEELMLLELEQAPDRSASVIERLARKRTVYRPELLDAMCKTCRLAANGARTFIQAADMVRAQRGAEGRRVSPRAIGSTLLLKGLEADHTVILDGDSMKCRHLYVAMSRGARRLTIVSKSPVLPIT